jgi:uncharacterized protein (DUF983 family)
VLLGHSVVLLCSICAHRITKHRTKTEAALLRVLLAPCVQVTLVLLHTLTVMTPDYNKT